MEDNEQLLVDQLTHLKGELKDTRSDRALYKKQIEDLIKNNDRNEIAVMLKPGFFKLIQEITWK